MAKPDDTPGMSGGNRFQDTPWSLVRHSHDVAILNELLKIYWKPLFFFVRRRGYDHETSKDIVQEFLTRLFRKAAISQADPGRGRFRTWILAALTNFLKDWKRSEMREKRGGGVVPLSLDFEGGERDYRVEVPVEASPEEALRKEWARSLLHASLEKLEAAPAQVEALRMRMRGMSYGEISAATGLTAAAAKSSTHRLRAQLRGIIEARIRATVSDEEEFRAELDEFLSLIS